ncbi:MAG: formate dehydrogenase accessory sulfurtransferase FdhD [Nitrospirota bacterium]
MDPYIKKIITRIQGTSSNETADYIAVEKRLSIFINGKKTMILYCTPLMIKELATGFLLTEEILTDRAYIENLEIKYEGEEIKIDILTGKNIIPETLVNLQRYGRVLFNKKMEFNKIKDNFSITLTALKNIFNEFQQKSELFRLTGCFHSAALSDGGKILAFSEDISRHNAVDKIIGSAILNDMSFTGKCLLVSCRISSTIISKCLKWEIPIIVSRAAPTDFAVDIAEKSGITLLGFVRGDYLNVYTNPQRIIS